MRRYSSLLDWYSGRTRSPSSSLACGRCPACGAAPSSHAPCHSPAVALTPTARPSQCTCVGSAPLESRGGGKKRPMGRRLLWRMGECGPKKGRPPVRRLTDAMHNARLPPPSYVRLVKKLRCHVDDVCVNWTELPLLAQLRLLSVCLSSYSTHFDCTGQKVTHRTRKITLPFSLPLPLRRS